MGRKRTPCEFCAEEFWYSEDGPNGHQIDIEVYPFNNVISVLSFSKTEDGEVSELGTQLEMNYCPVCGRKLD